MGHSSSTYRLGRRAALLLIVACLAESAPLAGLGVRPARAGDGGGGEGGGGGGGSDDGGSDDGGGSDNGGSDGGGSDGGGSGGASSSGSGGKSSGGTSSQAHDVDLAKRLKNKVAPVAEVAALASKVKPGEVIDISLFKLRNGYVYRVKVMQRNGSIYDLTFDAVTRRLLSARQR